MSRTESWIASGSGELAELPRTSFPRLGIAGASGRLGGVVVRQALAGGFPVVAAIQGRSATPRPTAVPPGVPWVPADALAPALDDVEVWMSATSPGAEAVLLPIVAARGIPAVIATTGIPDPRPPWLLDAARSVPIVLDANFSVGVRLLRRALRSIGPLPEGFDLSIVEAHRSGKADAPSGTSLRLAADLRPSGYERWGPANGRRRPGELEIASLRGGDTPGLHAVQLAGPHELLRFEHLAFGREAFATGMLTAARWLAGRRSSLAPGIYDLDDVLSGGRP